MGLIASVFRSLFGGGRNLVAEAVEVFRPNAEAEASRAHDLDSAALDQFTAEFGARGGRGYFDRFMDGLNRLPRPMLVMGVFGILVWTAFDPIASAEMFTSWSIIPSEFWYVVLAIVTFYFGGRHQAKVHEVQERLAGVAAGVPVMLDTLSDLEALRPESPSVADTGTDATGEIDAVVPEENAALTAWEGGQ